MSDQCAARFSCPGWPPGSGPIAWPASRNSESSLMCAHVAIPNIFPSPIITTLEVARVIATFTLLGLSMKPQSCQKLERVV
eukprot:1494151-Pyramimonas_sp.AAC.1